MTRVPAERISQQELILRLRLLIDGLCPLDPRTCNHVRCWYAMGELLTIALDNPRGIASRKVLHNIGVARTARLSAVLHDRLSPARREPVAKPMRATR